MARRDDSIMGLESSFVSLARQDQSWAASQQRRPLPTGSAAEQRSASTPRARPGSRLGSLDTSVVSVVPPNSSSSPSSSQKRVKVGIRCRPAFQDEVDFAKGQYFSIVDCKEEQEEFNSGTPPLSQVTLTLLSGKQRDFIYDYAFGPNVQQDAVFDKIARPVVNDVLKGFNGTIFAYGQTGTGKTFTMGILEFVKSDHAGIIPRAIAQIFEHCAKVDIGTEVTVTMSFLQLYRETIQDLLSPAGVASSQPGQQQDDNLLIREDPYKGFYVEGLQEFSVSSYAEAEALLNLGLENRAIAPTLMNSTSSRSHTVLTLTLEQRVVETARTLRSKLLMVDLAGSERVRRTVSKGTRLSEAKAINTSLSALGNVIAALAENNATHIPYRDSKLTRLLQDSLGGTASTALIATVGPAAVNYGETLSTLLFASRCMAVKTTPTQHERVDYAEMCVRLQEKISRVESDWMGKMSRQQDYYEGMIRELRSDASSSVSAQAPILLSKNEAVNNSAELGRVLDFVRAYAEDRPPLSTGSWMNTMLEAADSAEVLLPMLSFAYETLRQHAIDSGALLQANLDREEEQRQFLVETFNMESARERYRELEIASMTAHDPFAKQQAEEGEEKIGNHLAPLSHLEALTRVEGTFRSNSSPFSSSDHVDVSPLAVPLDRFPPSMAFSSLEEFSTAMAELSNIISTHATLLDVLNSRKDQHYQQLKGELASQMVERRKREEEVVNWSFILKYLLHNSSRLRRQLSDEKARHSANLAATATQHPRHPSPDSTGADTAGTGRRVHREALLGSRSEAAAAVRPVQPAQAYLQRFSTPSGLSSTPLQQFQQQQQQQQHQNGVAAPSAPTLSGAAGVQARRASFTEAVRAHLKGNSSSSSAPPAPSGVGGGAVAPAKRASFSDTVRSLLSPLAGKGPEPGRAPAGVNCEDDSDDDSDDDSEIDQLGPPSADDHSSDEEQSRDEMHEAHLTSAKAPEPVEVEVLVRQMGIIPGSEEAAQGQCNPPPA